MDQPSTSSGKRPVWFKPDKYMIKCIDLMHRGRNLRRGDVFPLQHVLEKAIYDKYGIKKDYTALIQSLLKPREEGEEIPETTNPVSFSDSSDDESDGDYIPFNLFENTLMCFRCQDGESELTNLIMECTKCHFLYHQKCHEPNVTMNECAGEWTCGNCKEVAQTKAIVPSTDDSTPVVDESMDEAKNKAMEKPMSPNQTDKLSKKRISVETYRRFYLKKRSAPKNENNEEKKE